jgi:hypothetical protein
MNEHMPEFVWKYRERPWRLGSGTLESRLRTCLDLLRKSNIKVPNDGRHMRALRLIERLNKGQLSLSQTDLGLLARVRAGFRTAWETYLIVYAAWTQRRKQKNPFTRNKLRAIMGGAELVDGRSTAAREVAAHQSGGPAAASQGP